MEEVIKGSDHNVLLTIKKKTGNTEFSFETYEESPDNVYIELYDKNNNQLQKWALTATSGYSSIVPVALVNGVYTATSDTNKCLIRLLGINTASSSIGQSYFLVKTKLRNAGFTDDTYYEPIYKIKKLNFIDASN